MTAELNGSPASIESLQELGLVNYGHFTSMRVDDSCIRGFSKHLDRLVHDCRTLFACDLDRDRVRELIRHVTERKRGSFVIRVTVFDPDLELGQPGKLGTPGILVTVRSAPELPASPLRVHTVAYRRGLPTVKHIGLFGAMCLRRAAQLDGFDDALFTDSASFLQEGPTWNIGFFDGSRVVWPNGSVLPGITMTLLKQVHDHSVTKPINMRDLARMTAAFATNTAIGVRPIRAIDNVELDSDHPIIGVLQKEYEEIPAERLSGVEV